MSGTDVAVAYEALQKLRNRLGRTSAACEDVDTLTAQAIAYVWGWADKSREAGAPFDLVASDAFGPAFGVVTARSYLYRKARPSIQDAWQSWRECGEIRANGTRLDIYDTTEEYPHA